MALMDEAAVSYQAVLTKIDKIKPTDLTRMQQATADELAQARGRLSRRYSQHRRRRQPGSPNCEPRSPGSPTCERQRRDQPTICLDDRGAERPDFAAEAAEHRARNQCCEQANRARKAAQATAGDGHFDRAIGRSSFCREPVVSDGARGDDQDEATAASPLRRHRPAPGRRRRPDAGQTRSRPIEFPARRPRSRSRHREPAAEPTVRG